MPMITTAKLDALKTHFRKLRNLVSDFDKLQDLYDNQEDENDLDNESICETQDDIYGEVFEIVRTILNERLVLPTAMRKKKLNAE